MYFHPNCDAGRERLHKKLLLYADQFSKEIELPVLLDEAVVNEAFDAAYGSAQFHRIPLGEISHYKELAHIGYWLAELKPISIEPPRSPQYFIDWLKEAADEVVFGNRARLRRVDQAYRRALEYHSNFQAYPTSEHLALRFIADGLESEMERKISEIKDDDKRDIVRKRFEHFKQVFYRDTFKNIVEGLRFHVFTPRSFATLIETVYAFEGYE